MNRPFSIESAASRRIMGSMDQFSSNPAPSSSKKTVAIVLLGALALALIAAWLYPASRAYLKDSLARAAQVFGAHVVAEASGTIYVSLASVDDARSSYLNAFALDAATGKSMPLLDATNTDYYAPAFSPDGSTVALVESTGATSSIDFAYAPGSDGRLTIQKRFVTSTADPSYPVWSADGSAVTYSAPASSGVDSDDPDNWNSYLMNVSDGSERWMATGAYPTFTPDGTIMLLRKDGLHLIYSNGQTATDTLAWKVENGVAVTNMRYAISPDGTAIAWAFPDLDKVYLLSVSSWNPFSASISTISDGAELSLPVFSPDGKFIALFDASKNRVQVLDRSTSALTPLFDTTAYYPQGVFISDWR